VLVIDENEARLEDEVRIKTKSEVFQRTTAGDDSHHAGTEITDLRGLL